MNNAKLKEWNDGIDKMRDARIEATESALKRRGWRRAVDLWFVRFFARIENMGRRWRDRAMDDE